MDTLPPPVTTSQESTPPQMEPAGNSRSILRTLQGDLPVPTPTYTETEIAEFMQKVQRLAVKAEYIDVGKCDPNPKILEVSIQSPLVLRNQDIAAHTVSFQDHTIAISPGERKSVRLDFISTPGAYGFSCDATKNNGTTVGFLFVTL